VAVRTSRAASVRAMPWEGTVPRSARGPDSEAGAAGAQRACGVPSVPPGATSRYFDGSVQKRISPKIRIQVYKVMN
jgi:hypothetical protein